MKTLILFTCLIPLISSFSQEIYFSRDTLRIDNINYQDSIVIYNRGNSILKIDSIKCKNTNYALNFISCNQSYDWKTLEEYVNPENAIAIQPNDSIRVRFELAYFLVKQMQSEYDQIDTMNFYNNSKNSQVESIIITNKFIMGGVEQENIPFEYNLSQNYPNPFNPSTTINYSVPRQSHVTIKVFDALGKEISTLVNKEKSVGNYSVEFNASRLTSGIYFCRMHAGDFVEIKKLLLIK
jgi:hypothetical protein